MSYVNKTSLRQEFDHQKMEFERLSAADKVTSESRMLINALLMLFEVMVGIFLERTTKKDAENSSKSSSRIEKDSIPSSLSSWLCPASCTLVVWVVTVFF
jgi:hypothetical protein